MNKGSLSTESTSLRITLYSLPFYRWRNRGRDGSNLISIILQVRSRIFNSLRTQGPRCPTYHVASFKGGSKTRLAPSLLAKSLCILQCHWNATPCLFIKHVLSTSSGPNNMLSAGHTSKQADTALTIEQWVKKNQLQKHRKRRMANNSSPFCVYAKFNMFNDVIDPKSQFDLSSRLN